MTPEELAQACANYARHNSVSYTGVEKVAEEAAGRILGVGRKYEVSPDVQGFELATIGTMLVGKREELLDEINYAAMIDILISRLPKPHEDVFESLRMDLQSSTSRTVETAILLDAYCDQLVAQGLYTPRPEDTYEDQLRAEQAVAKTIETLGLNEMGLNHHD